MGRCHGVALWMEYYLTDDITVSAGLMGPIGEQVSRFFFTSPFHSPYFVPPVVEIRSALLSV